jgi:ADP-ribose pyrophosphatase YjhB (NUDIX family)
MDGTFTVVGQVEEPKKCNSNNESHKQKNQKRHDRRAKKRLAKKEALSVNLSLADQSIQPDDCPEIHVQSSTVSQSGDQSSTVLQPGVQSFTVLQPGVQSFTVLQPGVQSSTVPQPGDLELSAPPEQPEQRITKTHKKKEKKLAKQALALLQQQAELLAEEEKQSLPDGKKKEKGGPTCAGFVVLTRDDAKKEYVALVTTHKKNAGYPKGKMKYGETYEECAYRELFEETGLKKDQVTSFDMSQTFFNEVTDKGTVSVRLFLATTNGRIPLKVQDTTELESAEWVEVNKASKILTIKNRSAILTSALTAFNK